MDLRTALNNLRTIYPRFPREELECIRANKDEAIPRLLDRLKLVLEEDYAGDVEFVIFPLAVFRVQEAFPLLLELLHWDEESLEQVALHILGNIQPGDSLLRHSGGHSRAEGNRHKRQPVRARPQRGTGRAENPVRGRQNGP